MSNVYIYLIFIFIVLASFYASHLKYNGTTSNVNWWNILFNNPVTELQYVLLFKIFHKIKRTCENSCISFTYIMLLYKISM